MNGEYCIKISKEEAEVLDYVLTLHSWNPEVLADLMVDSVQDIRLNAGKIIIEEDHTLILRTEQDLRWLLAIVPITLDIGKNDAGHSLKVKLYKAYYRIEEREDADSSPIT